uniref:Minor capsid protein L2 n=1 Tax=Human papillomavirus TaxID=10566 RepID=A0A385PPQ8_9PAPI|nr:MAG: L2 protein [Human papillomavirus]
MERAKRRKRASVTDLYKSCALGGDCIPDVQNKVEGKTLADILLKVFGSVLYLGGLGIGTGRGTGGQFGYRPFGGTPRQPIQATPTRPAIPLDGIGPVDVLPIDPTAPAIVPLSEGLPDPAVIDIPGASPGLPSDTLDVTTILDDLSEVTGVGEHPNIIQNTNEVAQIDIQVQPPPPTRVILDSGVRNTDVNLFSHASHVDSDYNVFVDAQMNATHIGEAEITPVENIELQEINLVEQFEIQENPVESTPLSDRLITRARDLYRRYTEQVPTEQVLNVTTPRVTFQFENPAFEDEISNVFQKEVQAIANSDVDDLVTLSDIRLNQLPDRTVRVSRLGHRLGMTTRSGLQIGQQVHLYYDMSPIPNDSIELQMLGESSHISTLVDELTTSSFINVFEQPIEGTLEFSDETLVDNLEESFTGHLIVTTTDTAGDSIDFPVLPASSSFKMFVDDYGKDVLVFHPSTNTSSVDITEFPYTQLQPSIIYDMEGSDFDIHPSVIRRKRKRPYF